MKNMMRLSMASVLLLGATSVFATNGSNLIATGSTARAMGGLGIGTPNGAESALSNVALMNEVKANEVAFGGMFFMPDVKNTNYMGQGNGTGESASDLNVIPEISIASKITDNFHLGIGIWGTAGMGVDYRDKKNAMQLNMVTNLQLMQFAIPFAYTKGNFSIGLTPILQYGSLDINYNNKGTTVGAGVGQDLEFGYNIGVAYRYNGFTFGAMYKSQIDMKYKGVLTATVSPMAPGYSNDKLSTPEEMGVGMSYRNEHHTIGVDFKYINWDEAKGYKDFDWEDQKVVAIGYEYRKAKWALRAGYNYAKSPISEQTSTKPNSAGLTSGVANTFNALGFPGIIETHYTFGGEMQVRQYTSVAFAVVYAPEVTKTFKNFMNQDITVKHQQTSVSFDVKYKF
ncbi:putative facilitator of salicylate uptake [hydrothermal vent metagenome]|uniref:Putative facilitator of salicylate uptake n=1 Tax=hydrothermal vent metagenome TaxID=652676 RepID=A0A1W1D3Z7_9ZZZZ